MLAVAHPLTPERLDDLDALFAMAGCSFARGCWCMEYRERARPSADAGQPLGPPRREALHCLVAKGVAPGLVGNDGAGAPVGWIGMGPRSQFAKLARSRVMAAVDDAPVWSIVCFVVPSPLRGQGIAAELLAHGVRHARASGATTLEAYPVDKPTRSQGQWLWHGAASMFRSAGFDEVARRKPERPVMRLAL